MENWKEKLCNSLNMRELDPSFFLEIAYMIVENLNLKDYVNEILICNDLYCHAEYDYNTKTIRLRKNDFSNEALDYCSLFNSLFHEIEHTKQYRLINEYGSFDSPFFRSVYAKQVDGLKKMQKALILYKSFKYQDYDDRANELYHFYPTEREAYYYGALNSYMFLKDILKLGSGIYSGAFEAFDITRYDNFVLMHLLLEGYEVDLINSKLVSPIEKIIPKSVSDTDRERLLNSEYLDDYDKLILGLPIEYEKYLLCCETVNVRGKIPKDIKQFVLSLK